MQSGGILHESARFGGQRICSRIYVGRCVHHYSDVRIPSGMRHYVAAGRKIRSAPLHTFAAPRGLMTDVVCEYVSWRDPYDGASEGTT